MTKLYSWVNKASADLENWKKSEWTYTWKGIASNQAFWVFEAGSEYKASKSITKERILLVFDVGAQMASIIKNKSYQIDFESEKFKGESKHVSLIIVKNNEKGAYGIGRDVRGMLEVSISLATKKEVAKALGVSEMEVPKKQTW